MFYLDTDQFDALKKAVLNVADITSLTPADCKVIENKIFTKTGMRVSETTLKRIFGFALSRFSPSTFTLTALVKYVNYDDLEEYLTRHKTIPVNRESVNLNWLKLADNARKITSTTLQILKNKSGITVPV